MTPTTSGRRLAAAIALQRPSRCIPAALSPGAASRSHGRRQLLHLHARPGGQAARRRQQGLDGAPSARTLAELVDEQARLVPRRPAVGFASVTAATSHAVSYRGLRDLSLSAARALSASMEPPDAPTPVVGLLCSSSLGFVAAVLALMRLGRATLLLA